MPETARSKPLEIWFQDEARVGQQGTLTRIWAERGTRPRAPRDTRYIWSYIFGAVCPERAEAAALIMPHADTQAMSAHLAEIAKTVASGAHALLILDGAGWHGSAELEVPDNITLLKLPPYSPELNPMENVWAYLRANKLAISVFDNYEQIVDRCCEAWNFFANDKTAITSITTRQWAKRSTTRAVGINPSLTERQIGRYALFLLGSRTTLRKSTDPERKRTWPLNLFELPFSRYPHWVFGYRPQYMPMAMRGLILQPEMPRLKMIFRRRRAILPSP